MNISVLYAWYYLLLATGDNKIEHPPDDNDSWQKKVIGISFLTVLAFLSQ